MAVPLILSSVPNSTPYVQYVATNGQTVFPYPFPITQDSDLIVVVNGVTAATDSGYTLSGQGNSGGGNVTFTLGQTTGAIVTLYRNIAIDRISQIAQNSGFSSTVFNAEFNNIYLILQQLEDSIGFCLQVPNTNNPAPTTTLLPGAYANKYLSFDSNGNPTPAVLTSSGALTAAIIGGLIYPQSAAEQSAGVVPSNTQYPYGDIRRYGAVSGSDCVAAVVSAAAAYKLVVIPAGAWPMATTPTVAAGVVVAVQPGATFSGAGATAFGFTVGAIVEEIEQTTTTSDFATRYIRRNANHTGGTVGTVANALNATTFVGPNVTNNEWALLGVVYNSALASGQNVGGYLQGNRMTTTATETWGGTIEVKDQSGQANPTVGLVGLEVDCRANGADTNLTRVGVDVVFSRLVPGSGTAVRGAYGVRVQNTGEGASAILNTGFSLWANCDVGFDTSLATLNTQIAYKMAQGQVIAFDTSGANQLTYNGAMIAYGISGSLKTGLLASGGLWVLNNQVVGGQIAGYGTPTGGSHQASFSAGGITLANLAAAVAQLIVDLKTHGLIGA